MPATRSNIAATPQCSHWTTAGCSDEKPTSLSVMVGTFDPIVAHGLESVLRGAPDLKIVATGMHPDAFQKAAVALGSSVVLVDEILGSTAIENLRARVSGAGIVVFARNPTPAYGRLLLAFGVSCVDWSVLADDLLTTVRRTALGDRVFMPSDGHSIEWREDDPKLLSRREQQVLGYLSQDLSHARIAAELGMARRTVGTHATRIYQKLEVGSRREAAELVSQGWFGELIR